MSALNDGFLGGRGRVRRRMFDSGELRLVVLGLIAERPRHGYDLIRAIEDHAGGAYAPSPGIVYPTLTLLAEMGLVSEQAADGARKLFEITAEGAAYVEEQAREMEAILARLATVGRSKGQIDVAPLRRAMLNLRNVLDHRQGAGLDETRMFQAVALIDETARKIERL